MTYQEALRVVPGATVLYHGRLTEVLTVEHRSADAIYFRLTGIPEPQHFASVYPVDAQLRAPAFDRLLK